MYNLLWYHLGKQHGGGGGSSGGGTGPVLDVLLDKTIANFASDANWGGIYTATRVYSVDGFESFTMTEGENYTVVWDGIEHKVTARNVPGMAGFLLVGNGDLVGLPSKNELFAIAWSNDTVVFFSLETKTSHDVRIYKTVIENAEAPSVALDFTNGNQTIRPSEDGKALDEVVVEKPDTLLPENIAEGVDIAGVIGTLAAGGGGGEGNTARFAMGTFGTSITSTTTITHGMGEIPDIIIIVGSVASAPKNTFVSAIGYSQAFKSKYGKGNQTRVYISSNSSTYVANYNTGALENTWDTAPLRKTTETTFDIQGSSLYTINAGSMWIAIAGLI